MTTPDPRATAERIILGHATDVEYLSVVEMLSDLIEDDNEPRLSAEDFEATCQEVHRLIRSATIVVSWPDEEPTATLAEFIAAAIEAYEPAAHPVYCPPDIAYKAAMERAATIARDMGATAEVTA